MNYKIYPIWLGSTHVDRSLYEYRAPGGEKIEAAFGCFLIKGNGHTILFDSGIPSQEEIHRCGFTFGYMDHAPYVIDELEKMGEKPEEVDTIILSHLHWDHSWNLEKFPNAKIYVQKEELRHAVAPLPHERAAYGLKPEVENCPSWAAHISRMIPVDGDKDLYEGIRMITTPGHTTGSQSVVVDTADGQYALVSDFALTARCYDECVVTGIFSSADDWYYSYYKLRDIGAKVLCTHEPATYRQKCVG